MPKRLISLLLILLLLPLALPAQAAAPDSVLVALVVEPDMTLNPLQIRLRDPMNMLSLVYEGLVALDDNRRPVPALASSWEDSSGDGRRWVFHIREGALFHDGSEVTAYDVVATLDRIKQIAGFNEKNETEVPLEDQGVYRNLLLAYIRSWTATDERTVEITAARPYYGLLNAMTFPILPAAYMDQELPPGTGPYKIEEYTPGERLWITSWHQWYNTPATVTNILGFFYANTEEALNAYEYNEVDIAFTRGLAATRYSGSLSTFYLPYRTNQMEVLLMQHYGTLPTSSLAVRRAIAAAIDPAAIAKDVYQNMATLIDTTQMPGTWLYDSTVVGEGYNPALAASLLEEEGWILTDDGFRYKTVNGEPKQLSLRLRVYDEPNSSVRRNAASMISTYLKAVGINVRTISGTHAAVSSSLASGDFELALCAYQMDVVPDPGFLFMGGNASRYSSENMRNLVTELRKANNEGNYYSLMVQIQQQQVMDVPFLPLYYRNGAMLTRNSFTQARDVREGELLRGIESWR